MKNNLILVEENKTQIIKVLTFFFFFIAFVEVFSEFKENVLLQTITKPLLLPLLFFIYIFEARRTSFLYIIALFLNWLANIFFISKNIDFILIASFLFLLSRVLIIIKTCRDVKLTSCFPVIIASIPFMFFFLYLIYLIFNNTTTITFLILIFQSLLMTILGGYALGNYVMKNNYSSKMLMLSSICFGINLFVLGVKFYYLDLTFLKPISMVFFIGGHLAFLKFVLLSENEQTHKDSFIL